MPVKREKDTMFNSNINVLGSVPDYASMIKYALDSINGCDNNDFSFRTEKSVTRFAAAIKLDIMTFQNESHKKLIVESLSSDSLRLDQKLLVVFWQFVINNKLFNLVTDNYYMNCVYAGRLSLQSKEIESYLYELRREYPKELQWSDATLKITASKYLTMMKKLGLAEGNQQKQIRYPAIGDEIFIILVKLALSVYPDQPNETNPLFRFSFLDNQSLINRLKSIRFTPLWNIIQLGNNIKIELIYE